MKCLNCNKEVYTYYKEGIQCKIKIWAFLCEDCLKNNLNKGDMKNEGIKEGHYNYFCKS